MTTVEPRPSGRPNGTGMAPYKLFITLLYGKHKWIDRSDVRIRVPVARLASHMRTRANRVREYLYLLENWGLINHVRWNSYWLTIDIIAPVGMIKVIPSQEDIDAEPITTIDYLLDDDDMSSERVYNEQR